MTGMSISAPPPEIKLVHSELLCFALTHAHNSTLTMLAECLNEFYRPKEVLHARETFWRECHDLLKDARKPRRSQTPVDRQMMRPFVDDVCSWIGTLVNNQRCENMNVQFYVLNLRRTPPCSPEKINIFSLAARVAALERTRKSCTQTRCSSGCSGSWTIFWDSILVPEQPRNGEAPSRKSPSTAGLHTSKPVAVTAESAGGAPWSTVVKRKTIKKRDEARKQLRNAAKDLRVVVGTEKGTVLNCCRPTKQLFVNHLERCSMDTVKKYMISKGVTPRDVHCTCTSKESWLNASFRLTVVATDMDRYVVGNGCQMHQNKRQASVSTCDDPQDDFPETHCSGMEDAKDHDNAADDAAADDAADDVDDHNRHG
ncbi:hypothetical protein CAPTEDRAFT_211382 [Capitella teleta]|uniref:Uncharacterized protein n=1 Tax=Capitella teleta TaxID=283909 RepID=R7U3K9_CAPTE|nr:hypothetical protein CAPTEDRAFT_211382 [Capitella teleta]|eukprot:ELU00559.1 hypothetical protein CAPTEDRAFT_211382 [Capitella teleta]